MPALRHLRAGLAALSLALCALLSNSPAQAEEPLTPAQTEAVQKTVREYLMQHPEVIVDALQALEARQQEQEKAAQQIALKELREKIEKDPSAPTMGKPDAAVTVVEFFDYRCPYCKAVAASLIDTLRADQDVRFVFKEFPILGNDSIYAAKAALAAEKQGKYLPLHLALMQFKGTLNEAAVLDLAQKAGLDVSQLKRDMEAPEIEAALRRNHELAAALRINGTPAFVVGDELIPGAISVEDLKQYVAAARKS